MENYKTLMREIRRHKEMERYFMTLGGTNQYCEYDSTTKCNLQIQCDPYQLTNGIFHTTRGKRIHNIYGNTKYPNGQSSLDKEEWSWRNQPS